MKTVRWLGVLLVLGGAGEAAAHPLRFHGALRRVNHRLAGQVLDFSRNHGRDNRIWWPSLCAKRDLYVYLPPGFDPCKQYPLILWLHGFAQDEGSFIRDVVEPLDRAMACGKLAPAILAAPDGSLKGNDCLFTAGSFFLNSKAGRFEDFLMVDVWNFLFENFPIRPEREAHVVAGVSMGGGAAYNKAIKYADRFASVVGIFPPVNVRWQDCRGKYLANFDPCCWGWKTDYSRGLEVVGRFYGIIAIRQKNVVFPLYGRRNPDTAALIAAENPIEMLDAYGVKEGLLDMYIAYGGRDQFNIDAQVESFLYFCKERGLTVQVGYDPNGKHDRPTAYRLLPGVLDWLGARLAPYACP